MAEYSESTTFSDNIDHCAKVHKALNETPCDKQKYVIQLIFLLIF